MLAGRLRVGRLASAGVNLAPAGVGVDTGGKIVRRSINQRSGAIDGGIRGSVCRRRLHLIIDSNPSGSRFGSLLESRSIGFEIALIADDCGMGRSRKAN